MTVISANHISGEYEDDKKAETVARYMFWEDWFQKNIPSIRDTIASGGNMQCHCMTTS